MAVALYEPTQEASSFLNEVQSALQDFAQHFRDGCQLLSPRELAETTTAVEELSKTVEQLQISAAHALDQQKVATTGESDHRFSWADPASLEPDGVEPGKRTEFRDTADYLRERLKISRSEARRRLRLGESTQPATLITGEQAPPKLPMLGAALAGSHISGRAATLIRDAVERVRPTARAEDLQAMEQMLTRQAAEADTDILVEVIKCWEAGLDPDGREPSDEFLRARQGVFIRGRRNGLHRIEIAATDEQYEYLVTVMNTSTNPRLGRTFAPEDGNEDAGQAAAMDSDGVVQPAPAEPTRAQKLLAGLVDACRMALAADKLPATGGHRPQVMVTIDYEELKKQVGGTGQAVFGGLTSAGTVRRIACDADLIPVVLGGRGEVLDVGRAQRLFTPAMRRALVARDGGCAFPGCTIPAPWTEAHHIIWWEHGGTTSTDNGCLLCSFHHHLIHQGHWQVESRGGIPWFIPPPWTDPERKPLRNRYRQACVSQPAGSPPGAGP
ncbi:HNH endonuclease [Arthrobacter sp. I2-34]|uniref:HNH endonuclease n=1 Tax=Arthrobacter hankyongi TaxID=2904801 RepID=A0ABS9L2K9_9MICC|nr:HNH endonuclease signature motif containing protein [Arthrobacter hankyongi]MCG2620896.1 HNH endonuclease [Arthrobacter hankyongi]